MSKFPQDVLEILKNSAMLLTHIAEEVLGISNGRLVSAEFNHCEPRTLHGLFDQVSVDGLFHEFSSENPCNEAAKNEHNNHVDRRRQSHVVESDVMPWIPTPRMKDGLYTNRNHRTI